MDGFCRFTASAASISRKCAFGRGGKKVDTTNVHRLRAGLARTRWLAGACARGVRRARRVLEHLAYCQLANERIKLFDVSNGMLERVLRALVAAVEDLRCHVEGGARAPVNTRGMQVGVRGKEHEAACASLAAAAAAVSAAHSSEVGSSPSSPVKHRQQ